MRTVVSGSAGALTWLLRPMTPPGVRRSLKLRPGTSCFLPQSQGDRSHYRTTNWRLKVLAWAATQMALLFEIGALLVRASARLRHLHSA
jgi:hypothetical protein